MSKDYSELNTKDARIFRIIHRDNIPWILKNGLHCGNSEIRSDKWVSIGDPALTSERCITPVPLAPDRPITLKENKELLDVLYFPGDGGYLNDYVPFYFTPFSPMLCNILNGSRSDVKQRGHEEIVILVSNMHFLYKKQLPFLFTDAHATAACTNFYNSLDDLKHIDWPLLQRRDFKRDPDDPGKFQRYQAEALIYERCPVNALKGIVCYTDEVKKDLEQQTEQTGLTLPIKVSHRWYF